MVHRDERVGRHQLALLVHPDELADVVAAEPERGLRQVVRAEREELGRLRDLAGRDGRARQLDHGAPLQVLQLDGLALQDVGRHRLQLVEHLAQLGSRRDQRDHDLDPRVEALLLHPGRRLADRADLHRVEAGLHDAQADAAQAEHRVRLVELVHLLEHALLLRDVLAALLAERDLHGQLDLVRQELVQRRVEQPHRHRQPAHRPEDADEVLALEREQDVVRRLLLRLGLGEDHLPHGSDPLLAEEHVLGAAEADALGAAVRARSSTGRACRRSRGRAAAAARPPATINVSNAFQIFCSRASASPSRAFCEDGLLQRRLARRTPCR